MKNKTANLDLFHDMLPAEPKPDRDQERESKPEIKKQSPEGKSSRQNLKQDQKNEAAEKQHSPIIMSAEKDLDQEPEQDQRQGQEPESKPVNNGYQPMNIFPQAFAMMMPVWFYFCPGFPFGMPVMVLRPIIINPPVYTQN